MYTLIMDLDGTLIDSVPDISASLNRALESEGLSLLNVEQVRALISHGTRVMIENAMRASCNGKRDQEVNLDLLRDRFLAEYSARPTENTVVYPGVLEILDKFKTEGFRLGICTNKPEKTAYPVLRALGLEDYFSVIVCGDTLPYNKPDPRHVHEVVNLLGGDPATSVFVGDSEVDIAAARNAGLPMVLVSYGYSLSPPEELDFDALINHFNELPGILSTLI